MSFRGSDDVVVPYFIKEDPYTLVTIEKDVNHEYGEVTHDPIDVPHSSYILVDKGTTKKTEGVKVTFISQKTFTDQFPIGDWSTDEGDSKMQIKDASGNLLQEWPK